MYLHFDHFDQQVEPSWTCLGGIGIENDTFSAGSGALCVYGRNTTILEESFDLSVKFCGSNSIIGKSKCEIYTVIATMQPFQRQINYQEQTICRYP